MLPQINKTLIQSLEAVASSSIESSRDHRKEQNLRDFKRSPRLKKNQNEPPQEHPTETSKGSASALPLGSSGQEDQRNPEKGGKPKNSLKLVTTPKRQESEISSPLLELQAQMNEQKTQLLHQFGIKTYDTALRNRRTLLKRGVILDQDAT